MSTKKTTMTDRVETYVKWKQGAGYSLKGTAAELRRFARFADSIEHQGPVTISLTLHWAESANGSTRL